MWLLYEDPPGTKAYTLTAVIEDIFIHCSLPLNTMCIYSVQAYYDWGS